MFITKFGHSCILVEEKNTRILFDPGAYSSLQNDVQNLDVILITHDHADHCDPASLKIILANNPKAIIYTNTQVGAKLKAEGVSFELLEHGQKIDVRGVSIEAIGQDHAIIYSALPHTVNTGYFIAGRLYHPGDALYIPDRPVEILALPVCAPWSKVHETLDYVLAVKPRVTFPIHDAMLAITIGFYKWQEMFLPPAGIEWSVIPVGDSKAF